MRHELHGKILGIIFIVIAVLNITAYFWVFQIAEAFLPMMDIEADMDLIFTMIKYGLWTMILLISIPSIIIGIALIQNKNWSYTAALIIGLISIIFAPFWTIAGIYAIVVFIMRHDDMRAIKQSE